MQPKYNLRRREIARVMNWESFAMGISVLYTGGKSCEEIAEDIEGKSGGMVKISARSIERALKKIGVKVRSVAEAAELSKKKGRRAKK